MPKEPYIRADPKFDAVSNEVDVGRLKELCDLISSTHFTAVDHRRVYKLEPYPSSQARREQDATKVIFPEGDVSPFSIPWTLIVAAEDHLASLRLVIQRSSVFAPAVLTRSVVEAAARAWWLLDPSISVEERLRRVLNDQLRSAHEQHRLEQEMGHDLDGRNRLETVAMEAAAGGFEVSRDKKGLPNSIGEPPPGSGRLIEALFSKRVEGLGWLMWRHLSAIAHGTTYAVLSAFEHGPHPLDPKKSGALPVVKTSDVEQTVTISLLSYMAAFERMVEIFGWDIAYWQNWEHQVVAVLFPDLRA